MDWGGLVLANGCGSGRWCDFHCRGPEPEFRRVRKVARACSSHRRAETLTALRKLRIVDLWGGAMKSIWGIYSANEVAPNDDRALDRPGGTGGQAMDKWIARHAQWAKRQMEGQRGCDPLSSRRAFIALQPTCPFVREATLLPNTPAAMHSSKRPMSASPPVSRRHCLWLAQHSSAPTIAARSSCHLFLAAMVRQNRATLN